MGLLTESFFSLYVLNIKGCACSNSIISTGVAGTPSSFPTAAYSAPRGFVLDGWSGWPHSFKTVRKSNGKTFV